MGEYTGKKYRPSNGSEGDGFMEKFCANCIHEKYYHTMNDNDKMCDIISASMVYDLHEPNYPSQWTYDENDNPVCTAWSKWDWGNDDEGNGFNEPPQPPVDDPNQLVIPFMLEEVESNIAEEILEPHNV